MSTTIFSTRARPWVAAGVASLALALTSGCQSADAKAPGPIPTVASVDLPRFMGDWYVIANIPTFIERGAHNAVESYRLDADGNVATTFTFNKGAFDGPLKTYRPTGFIYNRETNAEWRMQFLWPFKAAFLIAYLDEAYETTIIAVPSRKYVWIMARTPSIPEVKYRELVDYLKQIGYDVSKLQRVPQQLRPTR